MRIRCCRSLGLRRLLGQFFLDLLQFGLKHLIVNGRLFTPRLSFGVWLRGIGRYLPTVDGLKTVGLFLKFGA